MTDFDKFKCRCSAIGKILAESRDNPCITERQLVTLSELEAKESLTEKQKESMAELLVRKANVSKTVLSDGCIDYLMEWYAWEMEGMIAVTRESLDTLALNKGKMVEVESGELLSRVDGVTYKQHKKRIYNDYLSGEIDFYLGEDVYHAINITDTKNSFDYPTFLRKINKGLVNGQESQVKGYLDISTAPVGYIANTLVDNPFEVIEEMRWKVAKKMNAISIESPDFLGEWPKWEHSMIFSHIPDHKRVSKVKIEPFTSFEQQRLYDRVKVCREWLSNFHEQYEKLNK